MEETVLSRAVRLLCSAGAIGAALAAMPAHAQETEQPMQRVVVTGSAIKRIDAETVVPVTVVRMEELKKQGINTVEQVLSNLAPVQASQGTSQVVGLSTGGASFADMRASAPTRPWSC